MSLSRPEDRDELQLRVYNLQFCKLFPLIYLFSPHFLSISGEIVSVGHPNHGHLEVKQNLSISNK